MIISDLKYIEISEETAIEGGFSLVLTPGSGFAALGPNNSVVIGSVLGSATVDPVTGVNSASLAIVGGAFAN